MLYAECTGERSAPGANAQDWSVQWTVRGDMIDFVVSATTSGWVAIGFSLDTVMVSSFIYCRHSYIYIYIHTYRYVPHTYKYHG